MREQRAVVAGGRVSIEVDYPDGTELTVNVEPLSDPFAHLAPEEDQALLASIEQGRDQA